MHVFRTPKQIKQINKKLNKQIAYIQMQLNACACPYNQQQLQHQLMQLITQQAML